MNCFTCKKMLHESINLCIACEEMFCPEHFDLNSLRCLECAKPITVETLNSGDCFVLRDKVYLRTNRIRGTVTMCVTRDGEILPVLSKQLILRVPRDWF